MNKEEIKKLRTIKNILLRATDLEPKGKIFNLIDEALTKIEELVIIR